ncbi:transcription factor TFIIH complex subunit Tfb2 [Schizosaccharomyces japonicus yFS275]|uniref:RNA polymerase II transcription factor B subunit 2 n=1 Tax=Schizosaccharomyces japonicus (strain yFS275 / FY16936) TaxID=402676 RepID=B6JWX6_SCHJY|nr:transcription factor TFIIH complex subunit Tfb2 [Schizosaccharomyces japonicus yFS275]EEB05877.1 transcription factor TFIIH complex subunit Tfb2 [Schizosaccharomyces japonicus yFS275]
MQAEFKTSINDYLEQLPNHMRLYQKPATCLAIFRLLPIIARQYVMAMLFNPSPVALNDFDLWTKLSSKVYQTESFNKLVRMHIFQVDGQNVILNSEFRQQFITALTGGGTHNSFGVPCIDEDRQRVDIEFLDKYATDTWETILHFMVGTSVKKIPGEGVLSLLRRGGLMTGTKNQVRITHSGFQFLLQDINTQIWTLLLEYLKLSEDTHMDPVQVLHFLFMLGSLELGRDYSVHFLTDTQQIMLEDLREYGLVYQKKSSSRRFYPTRLATSLTTEYHSPVKGAGSDAGKGFIIVETNYRLYAYTDSPLQIAILGLFTNLRARFSNLIVGVITRDSIRRALQSGITAEQIITYLTTHAHPQMRKEIPLLPPTLVDQIYLWELERNRLRATPGILFRDFLTDKDFEKAVQYAKELGVLVWDSSLKRMFFITNAGAQPMINFLKRRK